MDLLYHYFEKFLFLVNIFFGGFLNLLVWVALSSFIERAGKRNGKLGVVLFVLSLGFSFVLAKLVYFWGVHTFHTGVWTPALQETQGEAQSKASGLGYGYYYMNWGLSFLALFMGLSSLIQGKEKENSSEQEDV